MIISIKDKSWSIIQHLLSFRVEIRQPISLGTETSSFTAKINTSEGFEHGK